MTGNAARLLDHLAYGKTLSAAEVEGGAFAAAQQVFERKNMRLRQIAHMDVVADTGAVGRWVVRAEHRDLAALSVCDLQDQRNKVGFGEMRFAERTVRMRAAGIEIPQRGVPQAGRSRRTYRDFLRRFAVWHEEPHLDPEEFDLGFYSYGLRTYGNMPLIEPLESREVKKIRDFVIVVDTSESTAGELVKAFLKETFTLLKSQDSFFRQCRILVMQADNAVRDETWLNDLDALDRYTAQFTLVGGGGTDFRPAFARIAQLRQDGALRDLQGVLYFTDGKGIYPAKRPPFETAFLFLEDGTPPPDVPPWAMRLVLQPEEFDPKGR